MDGGSRWRGAPGEMAKLRVRAELGKADFSDFEVPPCERCGGVLKPDVVFFGDVVPTAVKEDAEREVQLAV